MKRAYELATLLMTLASCGAGFGRKHAGHCKFVQYGKNSVSTCNKAFHMRCLDQPLLEVPKGIWFVQNVRCDAAPSVMETAHASGQGEQAI